jgi:hypothetical protein
MSVIRSIAIAAVASLSLIGTASARDVFTVKFEGAAAERQVIAQNTVWTCEGDTCVARASHANVRACRQFVREADARVTAYGTEGNELSADEIARCNGDQPAALQAQN